jgi:signal transduction histidine kinase
MEIWAEDRDPSLARLWFKDNGLGIAPKDHQRIFRVFERIYPTKEYEGTGIGLSIVRKAVERMGAQVGLESELGRGSSFWIDLKKG